ncbi:MAG: 30S ribosomal protein S12 methylthiotransferase RimO [Bdellovibrionota bacterium]
MKQGSLNIVGETESACRDSTAFNITEDHTGVNLRKYKGNAAIVTLGCAKNQVDSEVMLGVLRNTGYQIVNDLKDADVAIVNTCGFLQSAVEESIDAVLNASDFKKTGRLRKLIMSGCVVSRYKGELAETLPEVDSFLTIDDILKVGEAANDGLGSILDEAARPYFLYDDKMPRQLSTQRHTAYVKISEGCNRPCTFCIIPGIRGKLRSRSLESVVKEVRDLGAAGVREINLIAQDLTDYGKGTGHNITDLLRAIDKTQAMDWVRLLYAYPVGINDALLDAIIELPSITEYLDLPLQHASESVLKRMQRPVGRFAPRAITEHIKTRQPGIAMRTTFIVGFPGETEADVRELEDLVKAGHYSSVGVFTYSQEQGTPAAEMENQVPEEEKHSRRERIMLAQQQVLETDLEEMLGKTIPVLIEGPHPETELIISSRARFQAPDVDGIVMINDFEDFAGVLKAGQMGEVELTEVSGYDLIGRLVRLESTRV